MDEEAAARVVARHRGHVLHPLYQTASWREEWSGCTALVDCFLLFALSTDKSQHLRLQAATLASAEQDLPRLLDSVHMLAGDWVDATWIPGRPGSHVHFFAATNAEGLKRYLFCLLTGDQLLVATSPFPNFEFAHRVLSTIVDLLEAGCPHLQLGWLLSCLVHATVQPIPGVRFELAFEAPHMNVNLTSEWGVDFLCNEDAFMGQCLDLLTAEMLVCAYTSLLLEHRLLLVSSSTVVLPLVSEVFLSLLSPMQWPHVYVPVLVAGMHHVIESPCPYIMGIGSIVSLQNCTDLEGVTIIDIDRGTICLPPNADTLPQSVEEALLQRVGEVMVQKCKLQFSRPAPNQRLGEPVANEQLAQIREVFVQQTLRLICARHCTVSAFYRSKHGEMFGVERLRGPAGLRPRIIGAGETATPQKRRVDSVHLVPLCETNKVVYGSLQMIEDQPISPREGCTAAPTVCWVELDQTALAIYDYADSPPCAWFPTSDICAVSSTSLNIENSAFEVQLQSKDTFRFCCMNSQVRDLWVKAFEARLAEAAAERATSDSRRPSMPSSPSHFKQILSELEDHSSSDASSHLFFSSSSPAPVHGFERQHLTEGQLRVQLLRSQSYDIFKTQLQGTRQPHIPMLVDTKCFLADEDILQYLPEDSTVSEGSDGTAPPKRRASSRGNVRRASGTADGTSALRMSVNEQPPPLSIPTKTLSSLCSDILSTVDWHRYTEDPTTDPASGQQKRHAHYRSTTGVQVCAMSSAFSGQGLDDIEAASNYLRHRFDRAWRQRQLHRIVCRTEHVMSIFRRAHVQQPQEPHSGSPISFSQGKDRPTITARVEFSFPHSPPSGHIVNDDTRQHSHSQLHLAMNASHTFGDYNQHLLDALLQTISTVPDESLWARHPIVRCLHGLVQVKCGRRTEALRALERGLFDNDKDMRTSVAEVLEPRGKITDVTTWLHHCASIGSLVGLHAYELTIRMLYDWVTRRVTRAFAARQSLHVPRPPAALGSPSTAMRARKTRWVVPTANSPGQTNNVGTFLNNRATWLEAPGDAVHVVTSLLRRLLSLLSPLGRQDINGNLDVAMTTMVLIKIKSSSEFELFEVHCCALHLVELSDLDDRERLAFFLNLHNLLVLHARIAKCAASEGSLRDLSFMNFCKDVRYKVGHHLFSCTEIEQAILRAHAAKPGLLGGIFSPRFNEKDPRKQLEISQMWPTATFGLCWGVRMGPPLMIFSPEAVEQELFECARNFLTAHTRVDSKRRTIIFPELIKYYQRDFGDNQEDAIWNLITYASEPLSSQVRELSAAYGRRLRVAFSTNQLGSGTRPTASALLRILPECDG